MKGPAALLMLVALSVAGSACGGDGETSSKAQAGGEVADRPLTVVAQDIKFPAGSFTAEAGTVAIEYRDDGTLPHTLLIEGVDGFKLEVAGNGDVDRDTVDLQAGEYVLYCDVAGHRQAGMEATLTVS